MALSSCFKEFYRNKKKLKWEEPCTQFHIWAIFGTRTKRRLIKNSLYSMKLRPHPPVRLWTQLEFSLMGDDCLDSFLLLVLVQRRTLCHIVVWHRAGHCLMGLGCPVRSHASAGNWVQIFIFKRNTKLDEFFFLYKARQLLQETCKHTHSLSTEQYGLPVQVTLSLHCCCWCPDSILA